jgi:ketosteroid isomerase-like protein
MSAADNKRAIRTAFDALAVGNGRPFVDLMADDFTWKITGRTAWSRSYVGKQAVRKELLEPLFAQFTTQYTNRASRIVADEDVVVVECRGHVTTRRGKAYDNEYCYVIRFAGGKMRELVEYFDTQLVTEALSAPDEVEAVG